MGQWGNFTTAISADGGLKNDDAKFNTLFFLEFLAEENQCDTKFLEGGHIGLKEINTNVEVGSVKYDPLKNAVSGEIRPIYGRKSGQIAAEGGFIVLQLRYMEADQSAAEGEWDNTKDFKDHPAEKTSFQLGLGDLPGLREGRRYSAELRFEIRPGLASEWTPFKFKARARPKIKLPSSPFIMQVGVANQIDCTVEGYPVPSIKWTKKGGNENVLSTNCSLMFPNATADDQGVYCVEAQNLVGCDTQEILVSFPELEKNEEQGRILDLVTKLSIQGDKQNEELEGLTDLVKKLSIRELEKSHHLASWKYLYSNIMKSSIIEIIDLFTRVFPKDEDEDEDEDENELDEWA